MLLTWSSDCTGTNLNIIVVTLDYVMSGIIALIYKGLQENHDLYQWRRLAAIQPTKNKRGWHTKTARISCQPHVNIAVHIHVISLSKGWCINHLCTSAQTISNRRVSPILSQKSDSSKNSNLYCVAWVKLGDMMEFKRRANVTKETLFLTDGQDIRPKYCWPSVFWSENVFNRVW